MKWILADNEEPFQLEIEANSQKGAMRKALKALGYTILKQEEETTCQKGH